MINLLHTVNIFPPSRATRVSFVWIIIYPCNQGFVKVNRKIIFCTTLASTDTVAIFTKGKSCHGVRHDNRIFSVLFMLILDVVDIIH